MSFLINTITKFSCSRLFSKTIRSTPSCLLPEGSGFQNMENFSQSRISPHLTSLSSVLSSLVPSIASFWSSYLHNSPTLTPFVILGALLWPIPTIISLSLHLKKCTKTLIGNPILDEDFKSRTSTSCCTQTRNWFTHQNTDYSNSVSVSCQSVKEEVHGWGSFIRILSKDYIALDLQSVSHSTLSKDTKVSGNLR